MKDAIIALLLVLLAVAVLASCGREEESLLGAPIHANRGAPVSGAGQQPTSRAARLPIIPTPAGLQLCAPLVPAPPPPPLRRRRGISLYPNQSDLS